MVVVNKVDRLARSAAHLHQIVKTLDKKGVGFKVLDDASLDTTARTGKLVLRTSNRVVRPRLLRESRTGTR
ncbi:hypothetical protein X769_00035 [Mesorhizobium sp. LSJC268A00]|nr:hypothetical protein X769_00035 [Mesorhizobium sp. LSJC268A00]ESX18023.1 hypothetical protein X767_25175 [Mesorhizobium sp. LSJC264A00]